VTTLAQARTIALGLLEAAEQDHHGTTSFRVRGKIFATVPDDTDLRVMVDEVEIRAVVAENPTACQPFYWGKRLACVPAQSFSKTPTYGSRVVAPRTRLRCQPVPFTSKFISLRETKSH
jgi:hypothetical protein